MLLRPVFLLLLAGGIPAPAQTPGGEATFASLERAYKLLEARQYAGAIAAFEEAAELAPDRPSIYKDLAYTLLRIGETEAGRDAFGKAILVDPSDHHTALEYAFLCFETGRRAEARRIFDRVRRDGAGPDQATAAEVFARIDGALAEGIARWQRAVELTPQDFSAHFELAQLAEERDDLALAAAHYEAAWRLRPDLREMLVTLGELWQRMGEPAKAHAALLAASRSEEPRTADRARELLPERYPYVSEFERALELDPGNTVLRRELAYLLLEMDRKEEAAEQFRRLLTPGGHDLEGADTQAAETGPERLVDATQLGLLLLGENRRDQAVPLLERVIESGNPELALTARAALGIPEPVPAAPSLPEPSVKAPSAREMGFASYEKGYLPDARRYLEQALLEDPGDDAVMLKLGWVHNTLEDDREALRWFGAARRSGDPTIAREAGRAYRNLRTARSPVETTVWALPLYSSRWNNLFTYSQVKTELKMGSVPLRPYASVRFVGDVRQRIGGAVPQYLSETSFIAAGGLRTHYWKGLMAWGEAGSAISYLNRRDQTGRMLPDYRGGAAWAKGFGKLLGASRGPGRFYETNADAVFVSRFNNNWLLQSQNRFGYTLPEATALGGLEWQLHWNANLTTDTKSQYWANFIEVGPGLQLRWKSWPPALRFTANFLRGVHLSNEGNPRGPNYNDIRIGFWYAFSH
jgi:tetratricopeptide (TPR) repeat protein